MAKWCGCSDKCWCLQFNCFIWYDFIILLSTHITYVVYEVDIAGHPLWRHSVLIGVLPATNAAAHSYSSHWVFDPHIVALVHCKPKEHTSYYNNKMEFECEFVWIAHLHMICISLFECCSQLPC